MEELNPLERDTIAEVGNISLGASATALSTILDKRVEITTPRLDILSIGAVKRKFPVPCLIAEVNYRAGLEGNNILLIKENDARAIAALMLGRDPTEDADQPLQELELSALQEAMNQMMGFMATSLSEMFARRIDISPPQIEMRNLAENDLVLDGLKEEDEVVQIAFRISVADLIDSNLIQLIPLASAKKMAGFLLGEESAAPPGDDRVSAAAAPEAPDDSPGGGAEEALLPGEGSAARGESGPVPFDLAEPPPLPRLDNDLHAGSTMEKLDLVKDLPMDITVILGRTRAPLGTLFALGKGDVIDLDGYINEPVQLLVNGKLVAYGEVVLVNEQLGVRITRMQLDPVPE